MVTLDRPGGSQLHDVARPEVAAVVVTRNRSGVLRETLQAIRNQQFTPASVLVVDNDSRDGTAAMLRQQFPEVGYHRLPENLGFGAGMAEAARGGCDYFWLLDDDSRPAPITLERCLGVADTMPRFGIIGLSGGTIRWGRLNVHPYIPTPDGRPTDPPLLNFSDFVALELDEDLTFRGNLGTGGDGRPSPPWRAYYRPATHLLMVIDTPVAARGGRLALPAGEVHRRRRHLVGPRGRADQAAPARRLARHARPQRPHHRPQALTKRRPRDRRTPA
jgi:glycosyltransferase involved in cell wall biosynthesis